MEFYFRMLTFELICVLLDLLLNRRPDISDGLKRLQCRTLIFVGDSSTFHSEALDMTAKLDRRYSALVEVCKYSTYDINQTPSFEDYHARFHHVEKSCDIVSIVRTDQLICVHDFVSIVGCLENC